MADSSILEDLNEEYEKAHDGAHDRQRAYSWEDTRLQLVEEDEPNMSQILKILFVAIAHAIEHESSLSPGGTPSVLQVRRRFQQLLKDGYDGHARGELLCLFSNALRLSACAHTC